MAHRSTGLGLTLLLVTAGCSTSPGKPARDSADAAQPTTSTTPPTKEGDQANHVSLSEAAFATARIETAAVQSELAAPEGALEIPGQIDFDSTRIAVISPRASGRIERIIAAAGQRVASGEVVAYLSSPQFLTAQSDFGQATRRATLLAGTPDALGAEALAAAARRRLLMLGASDAAVARLAAGGEPSLTLPVTAPFAGSILDVQALAGTAAEPGTPIFRMADLTVVNVIADVPERSLAEVHAGAAAVVHVGAYPDIAFKGRVVRTKDALDPSTRTAKVVISIANSAWRLKPGMFAAVGLPAGTGGGTASGVQRGLLSIPEEAVVTDGEMRFVFVQTGAREFERRTIEVLQPAAGVSTPRQVVVRAGLTPGERIVVRGAFILKSELAKAAFGEP